MMGHKRNRAGPRGTALIITVIFIAMFACLAVAITVTADTTMVVSRNRLDCQQAAALAESGVWLAQVHLSGKPVRGSKLAKDLHEDIASLLQSVWSQVAWHPSVTHGDSSAVVSGIFVPSNDGRTRSIDLVFRASTGAAYRPVIVVESTGHCGNASKTVYYHLTTLPSTSILGQYGVASKSKIRMKGNPSITGANRDSEGSILSATLIDLEAIELTGSVHISGNAAVCNPEAEILKRGNVTIEGGEVYGAAEPDWPQVDPSVFEPFATNPYTGGSGTYTNVRIPAGTNPNFTSDVTINGVLYVESPNVVTFAGNAQINGVIVTEKPAGEDFSNNALNFTGSFSTTGVESLPDVPAFHDLRQLTGTTILAEGFDLKFTGSFDTIGGYIVGSRFDFSGNAGGIIRGGVVNVSDSDFFVDGDVNIVIDKDNAPENPAGLVTRHILLCVPGSYSE